MVTLRGFIELKHKLREHENFEYFLPRAFNQDALENFFGAIRSYGVRNVSPDVNHFVHSFKSLIITNFLSVHSPGSNCQKDFSAGVLDSLEFFVFSATVYYFSQPYYEPE